MIQLLKDLPDKWLYSLTALLMPLSISMGIKFTMTDSFSFKRGDTEVKLGQIKQTVEQSDRLIENQQEIIQELIEASINVQQAAKEKKISLPEIKQVQKAVDKSGEITERIQSNNLELKTLTSEAIDKSLQQPALN